MHGPCHHTHTHARIAVTPGKYTLFDGFAHLASGLSCGLAGLAAGMAIGIVGDAGVRCVGCAAALACTAGVGVCVWRRSHASGQQPLSQDRAASGVPAVVVAAVCTQYCPRCLRWLNPSLLTRCHPLHACVGVCAPACVASVAGPTRSSQSCLWA
jgi:hypothetical protein